MQALDQVTVAAISAKRFVHFATQQLLSSSSNLHSDEKQRIEANLRIYEENMKLGSLSELSVEVRSSLTSDILELRRLLDEASIKHLTGCNNSTRVEDTALTKELPFGVETTSVENARIHNNQKNNVEATAEISNTVAAEDIPALLLRQQSMLSQEREQERVAQLAIANELSELTSLLRESTQAMSDAVARQNIDLASLQLAAEENSAELATQKKIMQKQENASSLSFMSAIAMLVFVFVSFVGTYFVIRAVPS